MTRRVQSATAYFGAVLGVWAVFSGCSSSENVPFTTGGGGSTATTGGTVSYGQGGTTLTNPATTARGGTTGATTGTTATTGTSAGGTTSTTTATTAATGGTTTTTTTAPSTGGTTTATTTSTNTGTTVTIASGKGVGAMTGYGFVALGALDFVTSPTCGTALTPITKATPCAADPNWSSTTALCVTGSIPALPTVPVASDYTNNWGLSVGLNATDPAGTGLGQAFTTVAITTTGTPATGLRAVVHRKGDAVDVGYCAMMTSGTAIAFTSFNTECYNTPVSGTALTAADVANIDQISVQVSSGAAAITVTNLCITGITFN